MQGVHSFSPPGLLNLKICTKASGHCRGEENLPGGREMGMMSTSQPHTPGREVFGNEGLAPVYQVKGRERRPETAFRKPEGIREQLPFLCRKGISPQPPGKVTEPLNPAFSAQGFPEKVCGRRAGASWGGRKKALGRNAWCCSLQPSRKSAYLAPLAS